ncbi:oligopeptide transporter [Teratosphaeria nubilosa]|uniref:Oligopeptide transporter n=1 Tax=Teratosphaeria nubilosa TaxID=161662 RepID=A0A6G1LKX0_9PEZI|nr:oligopeptide transporter [Teratosphaeria nubilosa]
MAPDRGGARFDDDADNELERHESSRSIAQEPVGQEPDPAFLRKRSEQPQFTVRALLVGLVIGVLIAFSNTYFGLQTGWISGMAMPSALIGFAYFKGLRAVMARVGGSVVEWGWGEGFSEVENVLVQTVAGSVGTMPLGCGFVGVVPALEYLLKPSETPGLGEADAVQEQGGLRLPLGKLILWALGLCFFGVMFAVPLRKEVIVREKLRFPSGTATALMIGVLHGGEKTGAEGNIEETNARQRKGSRHESGDEEAQGLLGISSAARHSSDELDGRREREDALKRDWAKQIRLLTIAFAVSGCYTLVSYFIPQFHSIPILGTYLSNVWLWELNPSPAYVGQGIIMGPATTIHMLLGALLGWAVLSPLAKYQGWASGDVGDWNTGSKGWIVWVSLAIMLADAIVSLGWLVLRPTIWYSRTLGPGIARSIRDKSLGRHLQDLATPIMRGYSPVNLDETPNSARSSRKTALPLAEEEYDAPPEHLIGVRTTLVGLLLSLGFCLFAVQYSFSGIISNGLTILAMVLALLLSIMGVRALGETDLNPVSGISKLTQLIFALVAPTGTKNAVTINLLAGAISESGALQAGDLLQDLKTGHLLGASPKAQFYGQLIGSGVGAVVSASVYKLYTNVYQIPGGLFQVPTGYVWIFTARLVTGQGLPPKTAIFSAGAAVIWALLTALRIYGQSRTNADGSKGAGWVAYVPGGIAVAVGMYNTPSFTLARTAGGLVAWWWMRWRGREETPMIVLASGLILGEGLVSIVNLGLASGGVPHL